jgi:hypothetical protein
MNILFLLNAELRISTQELGYKTKTNKISQNLYDLLGLDGKYYINKLYFL